MKLITGAAGFIGGHLAEALDDVVAIDNYLTGGNIAGIDIEDCDCQVVPDEPYTEIFHLASPASPVAYQAHPLETLRCGSHCTDVLMQLALKHKSKILVASTSEIYGDPLEHPQRETYYGNVNPIGPRSCYDEAKRFMEAMTMTYHKHYDVDTRIIRIFNTYGPRMATGDGRVVPNFINQALHNQDITIYGDGQQTRSFCYVDDMIEAIKIVIKDGNYMPYNIGNPHEVTVEDLAILIKELTNSKSEIVFKALPKDDPIKRKPVIDRIGELGWMPMIGIEEGLMRTIEYYERNNL